MKTEDKGSIPKVRVAVIGKSNVGKSALTVRYLTRRYIGEYRRNTDLLYRQTLNVCNSTVDVEIVDVCSCDLAKFPEEAVYWADACVVVYDITSASSLQHAVELMQRVQQLRNQIHLVLLGNKSDLEHLREVPETEGRTTAQQYGAQFCEISVAENTQAMYTSFDGLLNECKVLVNQPKSTRKFSVSKMIGTLIGASNNNSKVTNSTTSGAGGQQGGTVVVCNKSDLYKSRVLKRRQNFMATASL